MIFGQSLHLFFKVFKNKNKGIFLIRAWFVWPDKTREWPVIPSSFHSMVAPVFISGHTNQTRFKNNTFNL